jgi:hypothetical protein
MRFSQRWPPTRTAACSTTSATSPTHATATVDGRTLRGSGHHPSPQVHLLAAMDHTTRAVPGQTDVDGKTSEIARFPS